MFMHVGRSPSHFVMPFAVHKTVMGKETLAKLLDENFQEEMPMVTGYQDTWMVTMEPDEGADHGWAEAAKECVDFGLNVSSELSEERSGEESENSDQNEPVITI